MQIRLYTWMLHHKKVTEYPMECILLGIIALNGKDTRSHC